MLLPFVAYIHMWLVMRFGGNVSCKLITVWLEVEQASCLYSSPVSSMQEKKGVLYKFIRWRGASKEFTVNYLDYKKLLFLFNADPSEKCEL